MSELAIYKAAIENLGGMLSDPAAASADIETFTGRVISACLTEDVNVTPSAMDKLIRGFMSEIAGGPISYRATAQLEGVALRPTKVDLDVGLTVRQPTKEDLETPIYPTLFLSRMPATPSAIIEVQFLGGSDQQQLLRERVEQCVAALRLFRVGGVRWTSYSMDSDSVARRMMGGTMHAGAAGTPLETYVIMNEDEERLRNFWRAVSAALPKEVYGLQRSVSHITLAYDRYSDALLHNGVIERRVANAVMGMEALFVEETQELSFKLALRASKFLGAMGRDPLKVRAILTDAYGVRSTFAHGGHLTYKKKRKLERRYGQSKMMLLALLDYLRVSIVAMVICRTEKAEIIDMLDDALLDAGRDKYLGGRLAAARAAAIG